MEGAKSLKGMNLILNGKNDIVAVLEKMGEVAAELARFERMNVVEDLERVMKLRALIDKRMTKPSRD